MIEADAVSDPKRPPERLVFVFLSFNGSTSRKIVWRVPVPMGPEVNGRVDVAVLHQKLRAQCRTAAVRLILP
jgi:hypothetical protein